MSEEQPTSLQTVVVPIDSGAVPGTLPMHREINSSIFHRDFASKLAIREVDRLLVHRDQTNRVFALSHIRSHQCLPPSSTGEMAFSDLVEAVTLSVL